MAVVRLALITEGAASEGDKSINRDSKKGLSNTSTSCTVMLSFPPAALAKSIRSLAAVSR